MGEKSIIIWKFILKLFVSVNNQSLRISFSDDDVQGLSWMYAFNLCHGLDKNVNAKNGGCQNATVSKICFYGILNHHAALCLINEPEH